MRHHAILPLLGLLVLAASATAAPADLARARDVPAFMENHEAFLARARSGPIGLLFLGDSITAGWKNVPALWEERYGAHQPANFGIGGDQTQNVLWRIENGELDGISPRVVVLLIGTNNTASHSAPEITAAIAKIVSTVREKLPQTRVLLLAPFPRGPRLQRDGTPDPWEKRMAVIRDVNAALPSLADGTHVHFLDLGAHFLDAEGRIPEALMPDQLHLSPAGYRVWADAIQPMLDTLLR